MISNNPNRQYNINLRLILNNLYENKMNSLLSQLLCQNILKICKDLEIKESKYDTETLLYVLLILNELKEEYTYYKTSYYQVLTNLLINHDINPYYYWQFNDYLLRAQYIFNAKNGTIKFEKLPQKVPHGIFISTNHDDEIKLDRINILDYLTLSDFLEIHKCLKKIGFYFDKSFFPQSFFKDFKKWPDAANSLIYKIYFVFLQKESKEINEIKDYIKKEAKDIYVNKFIFILFAIELMKDPRSCTFWRLFAELEPEISKYNEERKIPINLIWILASYLSWEQFEKVIIKTYENLNDKFKEDYLEFAIKYYLEIFEEVNIQKNNYTYSLFVNKWSSLVKKDLEINLEAKYLNERPSATSLIVSSVTPYMEINATEEQFLNYNLKQKLKYFNNFLNNNQISFSNFDGLLYVINIDKDKEKILESFKRKIDNSYLSLIVGYFQAERPKNQLINLLRNLEFSNLIEKDFNEIFSIIDNVFKTNNFTVFFVFFYNTIWHDLSKFIKGSYYEFSKNNKINVFEQFYLKLKNIFSNNYIKIWSFFNKNLSFFESYKWRYFSIMSLFINPDEIFLKLNVKVLTKYKIDFIKYYFYSIELVVFNNWSFKNIYKEENEESLWMIFLSFIYWNMSNWQYSSFRYVPWLLKQKQNIMHEDNKEIFFLKLANTTDESLKLKNILQFGDIIMTRNFSGQEYCQINLFLFYITQEKELDTFLRYIKNNNEFYFSNPLVSYTTIRIVIDNLYFKDTSKKRKEKINSLFKIINSYYKKKMKKDEQLPYFSNDEINDIENGIFYNLTNKILFYILDFHYSSVNEINDWTVEKKQNMKLLFNKSEHSKFLHLHLLNRYINCNDIKVKKDLIDSIN